jgi:hypothetical protein
MNDFDGREEPLGLIDGDGQRCGLQPFQELGEKLHVDLPGWASVSVAWLWVMPGVALPEVKS